MCERRVCVHCVCVSECVCRDKCVRVKGVCVVPACVRVLVCIKGNCIIVCVQRVVYNRRGEKGSQQKQVPNE